MRALVRLVAVLLCASALAGCSKKDNVEIPKNPGGLVPGPKAGKGDGAPPPPPPPPPP